jgi:hypothetical protein
MVARRAARTPAACTACAVVSPFEGPREIEAAIFVDFFHETLPWRSDFSPGLPELQ